MKKIDPKYAFFTPLVLSDFGLVEKMLCCKRCRHSTESPPVADPETLEMKTSWICRHPTGQRFIINSKVINELCCEQFKPKIS